MANKGRTNSSRRRAAIGLAVLAAVLSAWALLQQAGTKVALPPGSPAERLNRIYGSVHLNAADTYAELLDRLPQDVMQRIVDRTTRSAGPLPPDIAAWVDDAEELAELARLAADCDGCFFKLEDAGGGFFRSASMSEWRSLATYYLTRARRAADCRDLPRFAESLQLLDRLGRHAQQQPSVIAQIFHGLFRLQAQQSLLEPLTWDELSDADREWYLSAAERLCEESPMTIRPFREEAELSGWSMRKNLGVGQRMLVSGARLNGELQRQLDPFAALLDQPIEQRLRPGNPLRMALAPPAGRRSVLRYVFNMPGVIADFAAYSMDGFVQADAKLVTMQRGNLAALHVHRHKLRTGQWPSSLRELDRAPAFDPYSARPLCYRRAGDEFVLYSVGEDGDDDGGVHTSNQRRNRQGGGAGSGGDTVIWPIWKDCEVDE